MLLLLGNQIPTFLQQGLQAGTLLLRVLKVVEDFRDLAGEGKLPFTALLLKLRRLLLMAALGFAEF